MVYYPGTEKRTRNEPPSGRARSCEMLAPKGFESHSKATGRHARGEPVTLGLWREGGAVQHTLKYLASLFIFGFNGIFASYVDATSTQIVFLRVLIGSVVLLGAFAITRKRWTFPDHKRAFGFLVLSGCAMGLQWLLLFEAFNHIGVGMATLLNYCGPIIVIALAPFVFKERMTWNKMLGILVVIGGVLLLNGTATGSLDLVGILCGLGAAVLYAVMVTFSKKASAIQGLENTTIQILSGLAIVFVVLLVKGEAQVSLPLYSVPAMLELGIVGTGAACLLYFSGIGTMNAQSVAVLGYLEPLGAVVLSAIILGEAMTGLQLVGVACIIGGACLAQMKPPARTLLKGWAKRQIA